MEVELPVGAFLTTPPELENMTQAELLKSEDTQLLKALEYLKAIPAVSIEPEPQPGAEDNE